MQFLKGFNAAVVLAVTIPVLSVASATNIYIAQISAGSANGGSCANAYAATFFNTSSNWGLGASQIGPGTTVHLCGTFTGTGGQQFFVAQGSGTSGSPITIKFETGAIIQEPYFGGGAMYLDGQSYITVDGGTNGIMQATLNGSPGATCIGGPCSEQQTGTAIQAFPCSNCEFKNLTIQDVYVHTMCEASSGCDIGIDQSSVNAMQFGGSNVLIHDNVFHDIGWVLLERSSNGDGNDQIYNNNIYNMDHGVAIGGGPGTTISTIFVYNNHFHDMANWDTGSADSYHHDGIHAFSSWSPVGKIQNLYIYNNLFDGNEGNCCVTAWIFLEGNTGPGSTPWTDSTGTLYMWNNILIGTLGTGNGQLSVGRGNGHEIFNNTIIATGVTNGAACVVFDTASTNVTFENNAVSGCNVLLGNGGVPPTSFTTIDYNAYGGDVTGGNPVFNYASHNSNTLAGWQSTCSCDTHSVASLGTPFAMTAEGVPQAGYIGIGTGTNLTSSAGGTLASLSSDTSAGEVHIPAAKPSVGPWSVGAYQYAATANPPTAVNVITQ